MHFTVWSHILSTVGDALRGLKKIGRQGRVENITCTQSSWIIGGWGGGELLDQRYFAGVSQRPPSRNCLESSYYTGKSLRNKGLHEVELNSVKPVVTESRDLLRSFYFILFYFIFPVMPRGWVGGYLLGIMKIFFQKEGRHFENQNAHRSSQ